MKCRKNICSFPRQIVETCGINLCMMWDVEANSLYDISSKESLFASKKRSVKSGHGIVVIRTTHGQGKMYHKKGTFDLNPGSLLLFDFDKVERYHTVKADWCYWWFEINCHVPLHIPKHQVLKAPVEPQDVKEVRFIFEMLRRKSVQAQRLAVASFMRILYKWSASCHNVKSNYMHEDKIYAVIDSMHGRVDRDYSVAEMAAMATLSVSCFRKAFQQITGKSPKQYFNSIKLAKALELLRFGKYNVNEVAYMLGFCDPYHFSRIFSKHYKKPPSHFKPDN